MPEFFGAVAGAGAGLPIDLQGFASLERSPCRSSDDRDAARKNDVGLARLRALDREHVEHAIHRAGRRIVKGAHAAVQDRRTCDHGIAHALDLRVETEFRAARHDVGPVDGIAVCADNAVIAHRFQWRRLIRHVELRGVLDEIRVGNLAARCVAQHNAGSGPAGLGRHAEPGRCSPDQLLPCRCAHLAHEFPVGFQAVAAADALTAVFPGIAVGGLDDAERHLPDRNIFPINVEFLGHHHWQCRAQALADLGLVAADDDPAPGGDLDEIADLSVTERAIRQFGSRDVRTGKSQHEAACHGSADDEELAATDCCISHAAPPPERSRRRGVSPCGCARRCRNGTTCWISSYRCPHRWGPGASRGSRRRP